MFACNKIREALQLYQESKGVLANLTMWVRGGESTLINQINVFMDMQKKEGLSDSNNLSSAQLYHFIYVLMPFSTSTERDSLMFAFAKVLPEQTYWWFKDLVDACQKEFFRGSLTQNNFMVELQRTAERASTQSEKSLQAKVSNS